MIRPVIRQHAPIRRVGVIDLGTNALHLYIVDVAPDGRHHVLLHQRELPRLGGGGLVDNRLAPAAMKRALIILRRYARLLQRWQVDHVEAVATSAAREAANGAAFVRRVRREIGIPLRIISGRDEARLIYQGVQLVHRFRRPTLIVSIGGGSIQVKVGDGGHPAYLVSVPLGGARLAQRFIHHDPPLAEEAAAMEMHARRVWAPVVRALRHHQWDQAWGSSATIDQLSLAAYLRSHRRPPTARQARWLTQPSLHRFITLVASCTAAQRKRLPGIDPRREDMVLPTAVALLTLMEGCAIRRLRYAPGSLREGLIFDALHSHSASAHAPAR